MPDTKLCRYFYGCVYGFAIFGVLYFGAGIALYACRANPIDADVAADRGDDFAFGTATNPDLGKTCDVSALVDVAKRRLDLPRPTPTVLCSVMDERGCPDRDGCYEPSLAMLGYGDERSYYKCKLDALDRREREAHEAADQRERDLEVVRLCEELLKAYESNPAKR